MKKRLTLYGCISLFLFFSGLLAFDLFTESDEEKIETLVSSIAQADDSKLDQVRHYLNPSLEPVEIIVSGKRQRFSGTSQNLAQATRSAFAPIQSTYLETVQESVEIENDRAQVNLRMHTSKGFVNLSMRLQKHQGQWLLSMLKLS